MLVNLQLVLVFCACIIPVSFLYYKVSYDGNNAFVDYQRLHHIPTGLKSTITSLSLTGNYIVEVGDKDLQEYPDLQSLKLNNNTISSSSNLGGLKAVKKLTKLDLSYNPIIWFSFYDLRFNPKLEIVNLSHNSKLRISNAVAHNNSFKKVRLMNCSLGDDIPWEIFYEFPQLAILDLLQNNIRTIPKPIYDYLINQSVSLLLDSHVNIKETTINGSENITEEATVNSYENKSDAHLNTIDSNTSSSMVFLPLYFPIAFIFIFFVLHLLCLLKFNAFCFGN